VICAMIWSTICFCVVGSILANVTSHMVEHLYEEPCSNTKRKDLICLEGGMNRPKRKLDT